MAINFKAAINKKRDPQGFDKELPVYHFLDVEIIK
jgi:hypothetical protein